MGKPKAAGAAAAPSCGCGRPLPPGARGALRASRPLPAICSPLRAPSGRGSPPAAEFCLSSDLLTGEKAAFSSFLGEIMIHNLKLVAGIQELCLHVLSKRFFFFLR